MSLSTTLCICKFFLETDRENLLKLSKLGTKLQWVKVAKSQNYFNCTPIILKSTKNLLHSTNYGQILVDLLKNGPWILFEIKQKKMQKQVKHKKKVRPFIFVEWPLKIFVRNNIKKTKKWENAWINVSAQKWNNFYVT